MSGKLVFGNRAGKACWHHRAPHLPIAQGQYWGYTWGMLKNLPLVVVFIAVSGCNAPLTFHGGDQPIDPDVLVMESPGDDVLRPRARATDPEVAAVPTPRADGFVGETLAGLGTPAERGLWLRTGLVADTRNGRIVTADGRNLALELRASDAEPGAGSQISLMAMQALGLPLGDLAILRVFVD